MLTIKHGVALAAALTAAVTAAWALIMMAGSQAILNV